MLAYVWIFSKYIYFLVGMYIYWMFSKYAYLLNDFGNMWQANIPSLKGTFVRIKQKCTQKHPPQDCQGECEDLNTCPNRHRVECKNGTYCIFLQSNSCEFLYANFWELKPNSEKETLQMVTSGYGMRISDIEDKLSTLEMLTKESTQNIKSLET